MDKYIKTQTFTLSIDEYGQEIYTSQADKSLNYTIDDQGNMIRYEPPKTICAIKLETPDLNVDDDDGSNEIAQLTTTSDSFDDDCTTTELTFEDATNLGLIQSIDTTEDFDKKLMNELDNALNDNNTLKNTNEQCNNIIMQLMDIREPLSKLRKLIEQRLCFNLPEYTFCLQGGQTLSDDKNLVDQCVQGQGTVQINVQLLTDVKRINILDVLKPADDFVEEEQQIEEDDKSSDKSIKNETNKTPTKNIVQWQVDSYYKKLQDRMKIPHDPMEWDEFQVRHWLQWAVRQFNLPNINLSDWLMNGRKLYELTLNDFHKIVPNDPGDIFWTHLELLRKMKVVAVKKETGSPSKRTKIMKHDKVHKIVPTYQTNQFQYYDDGNDSTKSKNSSSGSSNNNSNVGQIQLWQFLLELLTTRKYSSAIHWIGNQGQFKLKNPQLVAQLWGERKNKPHMNYEKLSRALRYYYDGDMISKVQGERFVYKFVCDLKQLLGYSVTELSNLVKNGNPMYSETRPEMFTMLLNN